MNIRIKEIWIHDEKYWLLDGGPIVPVGWDGRGLGYAHYYEDEQIVLRFGEVIATSGEIYVGDIVDVPVTLDLVANMIDTVLGEL